MKCLINQWFLKKINLKKSKSADILRKSFYFAALLCIICQHFVHFFQIVACNTVGNNMNNLICFCHIEARRFHTRSCICSSNKKLVYLISVNKRSKFLTCQCYSIRITFLQFSKLKFILYYEFLQITIFITSHSDFLNVLYSRIKARLVFVNNKTIIKSNAIVKI